MAQLSRDSSPGLRQLSSIGRARTGLPVPQALLYGALAVGTMKESPIFQHIKGTGATSAKPLREAFANWENLKRVLVSLFGATAGQGVVWYTGQFYALFYLQTVLKVNNTSANYIVAIALLLGMPLFVVFGALSDRIGRKRLMMAGCLLAAVSYLPIYKAMQAVSGSQVVTALSQRNPVTGAVSLTPQTMVDGVLRPAPEVLPFVGVATLLSSGTAWQLILLVFIQVVFVTMTFDDARKIGRAHV